MEDYTETKKDYDNGADWHVRKSLSYGWNDQIDRFAKGLKGIMILDAGCGGGRDTGEFLKRGLKVECIDYSAEIIKRAKGRYPSAIFHQGDMRKMELPDDKFDGVWACASLLNLRKADVPGTLSEFRRVLRQGGELFISVKEGTGEGMVPDKAGQRYYSFYSLDELKAMVENAGFRVFHTEKVTEEKLSARASGSGTLWICVFAHNSEGSSGF